MVMVCGGLIVAVWLVFGGWFVWQLILDLWFPVWGCPDCGWKGCETDYDSLGKRRCPACASGNDLVEV